MLMWGHCLMEKSFTSGGGALSTNNRNLFQKAKILAENGKSKGNYNYTMFGHNYKNGPICSM